MKKIKHLLLFVVILGITFSCTVEKRLYMRGYALNVKSQAKSSQIVSTEKPTQSTVNPIAETNTDVAIVNTENTNEEEILLASNSEVVFPITINSDNNKSSFKVDKNVKKSIEFQSLKKLRKEIKAKELMAANAPQEGDKSQVVALILCFFLGGLGIHRFYLGYTTVGIIQLLTAGGCGIWALIDFIRIILGDLQPANGKYDKTI